MFTSAFQAKPRGGDSVKGMDFEQEVLKLLQAMGFESTATSATRDGGIDILAYSAHA